MTRRDRRLTEASLLTVDEAVRELGGREADTRAWLRDRGLVREVAGLGRRVSWRQVLTLIEQDQGPTAPAPARPPGRLPRADLG